MTTTQQMRKCPNFKIRLMEEKDIDDTLVIWKEIGLYEGKYSIQTFRPIDPNGFYVTVNLDDNDKVIGCCGGVDSHPDCVFIGLYAMKKEFQNLGIGVQMFNAMMKHVGNKNAGLYPLEKHLVTYRDKAGFKISDQREVFVFETESCVTFENLIQELPSYEIVPFQENLLDAVVEFDEKIVYYKRPELLKLSFNEPESICRIVLDSNKKVKGFGCLRLHNVNRVIGGPIYCDNEQVAEVLIYHLVKNFPPIQRGLTLMIPDCAPGAHRIADKLNLPKVYKLKRLFTKQVPKGDMSKIYCIHSPNFYPF